MKKISFLLAFLFLACSLNFAQEKLGNEITLKKKTSISKINKSPKSFVGKKVLVEGKVTDVCQDAGCWMEIVSLDGKSQIKVKVKDGDIVFPVTAKDKTALVEGEVYEIKMNKEEAIDFYKHQAEDSGKPFDEKTVKGPVTIYQIKGLGAQIFSSETDTKKLN